MPKCAIANAKCPRTNDPEAKSYCPMWQEQVWENATTGDQKLRKQCGIPLLFESIQYGNSTAQHAMREASKTRNIVEMAALSARNLETMKAIS